MTLQILNIAASYQYTENAGVLQARIRCETARPWPSNKEKLGSDQLYNSEQCSKDASEYCRLDVYERFSAQQVASGSRIEQTFEGTMLPAICIFSRTQPKHPLIAHLIAQETVLPISLQQQVTGTPIIIVSLLVIQQLASTLLR